MEKRQEQNLMAVHHQHRLAACPGRKVTAEPGVASGPGADMTSVRFAQVARLLNQEAKRNGLSGPAFRSPPRVPKASGVTRSIRRRADGSSTVSVALRGRPAVAVVSDMIEGVIAANQGAAVHLSAVRDLLWAAASPSLMVADEERSQTPRAA